MRISAQHIGNSLRIKSIFKMEREAVVMRNPLILKRDKGYIAVFPFGVVVFWECSRARQQTFLDSIEEHIVHPFDTPLSEEEDVREGNTYAYSDDTITVPLVSLEAIAVISLILARSLALEKQEMSVDELLSRFSALKNRIQKGHRMPFSNGVLFRFSNEALDVQQATSISMSMLDTPDTVWNDSELFTFYKELLEEYEIEFRHRQLSNKLNLLVQHSEFIQHVIEHRQAFWLEMTIIILIVIEIVLFVYDLWFR